MAFGDPYRASNPDDPQAEHAALLRGIFYALLIGGGAGFKPSPWASAGTGQFGYAIGAAAKALIVPAGALAAQITVSGANVRYRDDGVAPTATVGMPVFQATSWLYSGPLTAIQFIAQSGNATLDVSYYR